MSDLVPSSQRILLVEDLALHRRLLPTRLGTLGREVAAVASAEEALAYLAHQQPHVILLDVIMPGKDGFTLCRELKADFKLRFISVLMLTDLKADAHERSIEAGADDYIPKRVDDAVLRIRVRLHLLLQELRFQNAGKELGSPQTAITLVTAASNLANQLPAQFALDGYRTQIIGDLPSLGVQVGEGPDMVVLDASVDPDGIPEALTLFRADPATQHVPVVLLCDRGELDLLPLVENMVDDVLWKPLNAKVTRFRLKLLQELAVRSRAEFTH